MRSLLKYRSNIHSQNGEDGILSEIFRRLSIKQGWFVEFGAWDGIHMSNAYALLEKGWKGVDIEGDAERFLDLQATAKHFPRKLYCIQSFVSDKGKNRLDALFQGTPLPKDFELLSVDIDSYDWYIWKALKQYKPKVVVIEINSSIPLGISYVQPNGIPYEPLLEEGTLTGSSFTAMLELGQQKGYTLVCHTGNMIFVRNDLVDALHLPERELANPNKLFLDDWVDKDPYLLAGFKWLKKHVTSA